MNPVRTTLLRKVAVSLLLAPLLLGCSNTENDTAKTLKIGVVIPEGGDQTLEKLDVMTRYFSRKLGMGVKQIQVSDNSAIIEAMRARKIDVGSAGAFTYLVASKNASAEAIITTATADGNPNYYNSAFITSSKSGITSIEEVLKAPKNYTLAWAYPTSTSGHLVPRYYLQQQGIMPDDFKEVFTSTDHAATVLSAVSGKVDMAAVMIATVEHFVETGRIKPTDYRVLWTSEPIAQGPVFVRKDMDRALKKKIQQAYLDMETEDTAAYNALRTQYNRGMKYIIVDDSHYQSLRDMANQIKGLELEEK